MPDMLVRLYDLPDPEPYYARVGQEGVTVRRGEPWDRPRLRAFIEQHFDARWAVEADLAFNNQPITAFVATLGSDIVGFAVYECTRRNFFGPTGVRSDVRNKGIGAALLFRCLESMRELSYAYAIIGGVGPVSYYEKVCGASLIPGSDISVYGPIFDQIRRLQGRC